MLIQSGLAMLAMAKMSAARKRHPDITVSLSMTMAEEEEEEGGGGVVQLQARALTYCPLSRPDTRAGAGGVEIIVIDSQLPAVCAAAAPSQMRVREDSRAPRRPRHVDMLLDFPQKTLYRILAPKDARGLGGGRGYRRSALLPRLRVPFSFGVTRSARAAHGCASRNASCSRFRSRQAAERAEGLVA